jgi:hypothetical protein
LPADEDLFSVIYILRAAVPGSEHIGCGDDTGVEISYSGDEVVLYDIEVEYIDGEYVVHR